MDIIDKIFHLLKTNNYKAVDLAKAIGASESNISDWRKRRAKPSIDKLAKIADFFDVSADYLLGLTDNPKRATYNFTYEEVKVIEAYRKQPEEQKGVQKLLGIYEEQPRKMEA